MKDLQIINYRQFAWLSASLVTGGGLLQIQHELVRTADTDAWFAYLLPTAYLFGIAYLFGYLTQRFPEKHIYEITKILFGKLIGNLVNLVLIFHLWLILVRDLRSMSKFVGTILLPNTPDEMLVMVLVLLLMFYGRTSIEVIARVNDLFFPILFGLVILLPLLLSNEVQTNLIQPTLASPYLDHLKINLLTYGWYADLFVIGAFLHTLWSAKQITASLRHGTAIATFLLSILVLVEILVMGPYIPGNMVYPFYSLVQHIHITDFLDRLDLPVLMVYFPILICKFVIIHLAFLNGIASLLKSRDYTVINTPLSLFLLLSSLLAFKSTTEVFSFGNYSSPVLFLAYQPFLLIALWLMARKYPKRSPGELSSTGGDSEIKNQQTKGLLSPYIGQRSHRTWSRISNLLLAGMIGFVATGVFFAKFYSIIGMFCGGGFALSLLLLLGSTHMEIQAVKEQSVLRPADTASSGA